MKPIPKDTGSFLNVRNSGMLYVDKTAYFHKLIASTDKCFFLARPRRFGKSLMITALKEIFNGRKDLFEDLAIAKTDYDWRRHPVLHFNFGFCAEKSSYEDFDRSFSLYVRDVLAGVGCEYNDTVSPGANFGRAIDALAAKAYAEDSALPVILVDEYDDPLAKTLDRVEIAERVRDRMSSFFGQLKDRTEKFRGLAEFTNFAFPMKKCAAIFRDVAGGGEGLRRAVSRRSGDRPPYQARLARRSFFRAGNSQVSRRRI